MKSKPIYIVGGISRSGKTLLRERLLKNHGIEGISTDIIQGMIDRRQTEWEEKYEGADKLEHYWPYILSLLYYEARYSVNGYCIEGDLLTPQILKTIDPKVDLNVVFLGYKNAEVEDRYNFEVSSRPENSWTNKLEDSELKEHTEGAIKESIKLEVECRKFGFEYIDTSENFEQQIQKAEKYLVEKKG